MYVVHGECKKDCNFIQEVHIYRQTGIKTINRISLVVQRLPHRQQQPRDYHQSNSAYAVSPQIVLSIVECFSWLNPKNSWLGGKEKVRSLDDFLVLEARSSTKNHISCALWTSTTTTTVLSQNANLRSYNASSNTAITLELNVFLIGSLNIHLFLIVPRFR